MSLRRMMLFTLGAKIKNLIQAFKKRVLSSQGEFEAETCLDVQLTGLDNKGLLDSASLIVTPNGYKENVLFAVKPDKVVTNLLQQSETFENSYWSKSLGTITTNDAIAPNGTMTADLFTKTSAVNTVSTVWQTTITKFLSTGIYTLSVYIKPKTGNVALLRMDGSGNTANALFNFTTKTFTNIGVNIISSTYQELPNGWFRLSLTANVTNIAWGVDVCNLYGNPTGDAMWIWGAQLELGTTATDYISTTDRAIINGTIGDLTVTRATTGTRVNEQGLIEVVPYNLITYSEEFENAQWTKSNITIAQNSIISPNGDMTGDKLIEGTNNGLKYVSSSSLGTVGNVHTASIYLKANTRTWVYLTFGWDGSGDRAAYFDLINGVVGNLEGGVTASIVATGNGWYRCTITGTMLNNAPRFSLSMATGNGTRVYLGDGVSSIYAWGAQIVPGAQPRDYFPTTTRFNVPRLDYSFGSCPSILVEPQRTNVHLNSSTMWNMTAFALNGGTVPTKSRELNITSPTGYNDAVVIVGGNGSTGTWGIYQTIPTIINSGQQVTVSVFAKAGSNNFIFLNHANISFTGTSGAYFNLSNGTTPTNGARIENWGNGWYRCIMPTITLTANTSGAYNIGCYVAPSMSTNIWTTNYTGKSVYFFGIQVEVGSNVTSYIPTTTAAVTRNADVISKSGISNLIEQTEGTIFLEFIPKVLNSDIARIVSSSNTWSNGFFICINQGGNLQCIIRASDSYVVNSTIAVNISNTPVYKVVLKYSSGNIKIFVNGFLRNTHTATYTFSLLLNGVFLDNAQWTGSNQTRGINTLALWKTQITDAQAIQLTTL